MAAHIQFDDWHNGVKGPAPCPNSGQLQRTIPALELPVRSPGACTGTSSQLASPSAQSRLPPLPSTGAFPRSFPWWPCMLISISDSVSRGPTVLWCVEISCILCYFIGYTPRLFPKGFNSSQEEVWVSTIQWLLGLLGTGLLADNIYDETSEWLREVRKAFRVEVPQPTSLMGLSSSTTWIFWSTVLFHYHGFRTSWHPVLW